VDAPRPARDAFLVERLRAAGAVLLGKTNLSEWANFRGNRSTSGWSGRGGLTRNPYALDRNTSGSSSGSAAAVAASLAPVAVGTETDGSIVSPASLCGLVGVKPTVGLVSRAGIIPIAASQDTAGPMARSVRDAAVLLAALEGVDPADPATSAPGRPGPRDYLAGLDEGALAGARLGLVKGLLGQHAGVDRVARAALELLRARGATLVEVELSAKGYEAAELLVLLYEFKSGVAAYLGRRGGAVKDLAGVAAWNEAHADRELRWFGQELVVQAAAKGGLDSPEYLDAKTACAAARRELEAMLERERLDAFVGPTDGPAWVTDLVNGDHYGPSCATFAAVAGTPHVTVPAGAVSGLPVGLSFFGRAWSEPRLLALAHAFEEAARARRAPVYPATVKL
jgi:amidase